MSLVGKTVARTEEYGDRVFFTDGTSLVAGEYGVTVLDWAETQAYLHKQQGYRERQRMKRLHDTLHPRDQQYLRRLEQERAAVRRNSMGAFERAFTDVFVNEMRAQMVAANRILFEPRFGRPKLKRKHRPIKTYEPGKTYRRPDGSLFHCGGTINIPIKRGSP